MQRVVCVRARAHWLQRAAARAVPSGSRSPPRSARPSHPPIPLGTCVERLPSTTRHVEPAGDRKVRARAARSSAEPQPRSRRHANASGVRASRRRQRVTANSAPATATRPLALELQLGTDQRDLERRRIPWSCRPARSPGGARTDPSARPPERPAPEIPTARDPGPSSASPDRSTWIDLACS